MAMLDMLILLLCFLLNHYMISCASIFTLGTKSNGAYFRLIRLIKVIHIIFYDVVPYVLEIFFEVSFSNFAI